MMGHEPNLRVWSYRLGQVRPAEALLGLQWIGLGGTENLGSRLGVRKESRLGKAGVHWAEPAQPVVRLWFLLPLLERSFIFLDCVNMYGCFTRGRSIR